MLEEFRFGQISSVFNKIPYPTHLPQAEPKWLVHYSWLISAVINNAEEVVNYPHNETQMKKKFPVS